MTLQAARLGNNFRLDTSMLCAGQVIIWSMCDSSGEVWSGWMVTIGQTGSDACTGDGGGPLLCPLSSDPAKLVQVGGLSWIPRPFSTSSQIIRLPWSDNNSEIEGWDCKLGSGLWRHTRGLHWRWSLHPVDQVSIYTAITCIFEPVVWTIIEFKAKFYILFCSVHILRLWRVWPWNRLQGQNDRTELLIHLLLKTKPGWWLMPSMLNHTASQPGNLSYIEHAS